MADKTAERAPLDLLRDLVALPGPPGQEHAVTAYLTERLRSLGFATRTDAKGNLLAAPSLTLPEKPDVVVTAHMDEIALIATSVESDGTLRVAPLGGAHPWKWGEGPVEILGRDEQIVPGVLAFGSIHTTSPYSVAEQARTSALTWPQARVHTATAPVVLAAMGIRPGSRIVLARARRTLWPFGTDMIASYFLDDRADLVAWLLTLAALRDETGFENVLFAATAAEEVGGEGVAYLLHDIHPTVCVALEIGPRTPDAPFAVDSTPTVWVSDTYAAMDPRDLDLLDDASRELRMHLHWQAVTRGGSDATSAASRGLCARPVTLAFAAENSHGFEIMHRDAPENLSRLLLAYLRRLRETGISPP